MIENNLVKKLVKAIKSGKKSPLSDRSIMHPEREWFSSVMLGMILLVVGAYWSFSVYLQFSAVNLEAITTDGENVVYRDSLVEAALFEINRRAQTYDSLRANAVYIAPLPEPEVTEESPLPIEEEVTTPTIIEGGDLEIRAE